MPIYEYACPSCGTSFESLVLRPADAAEVECPGCRSREVTRQMSRPAAARVAGGGGGGGGDACGPVG